MSNLTVSVSIDNFMQSANAAAMQTAIGNPSGFITNFNLTGASGVLQDQITILSNGTGNFINNSTLTATSGVLQNQISILTNATGNYLTNLSGIHSGNGAGLTGLNLTGNGGHINLNLGSIYGANSKLSVGYNAGRAYGTEGNSAIDWYQRWLNDTNGNTVMSWDVPNITKPYLLGSWIVDNLEAGSITCSTNIEISGAYYGNGAYLTGIPSSNPNSVNTSGNQTISGFKIFDNQEITFKTASASVTNTGFFNTTFSIPTGYIFCCDQFEFITTRISGINLSTSGIFSGHFGTSNNRQEFLTGCRIESTGFGMRQIFNYAQNAISGSGAAGTYLSAHIYTGSRAPIHSGFFVFKGNIYSI